MRLRAADAVAAGKCRTGPSRLFPLFPRERHRKRAPHAGGQGREIRRRPAPRPRSGRLRLMDGVLSRPRPQSHGPHGGEAKAEGFLNDDATATLATRMLATMTGSEWISTPYSAHRPAATPCTRRNDVCCFVKYETRNTAVANQPIQSTWVIMP